MNSSLDEAFSCLETKEGKSTFLHYSTEILHHFTSAIVLHIVKNHGIILIRDEPVPSMEKISVLS